MSGDRSTFDVLRDSAAALVDPEHTGENRCLPCTLVNAVGVAVVAGLLSRRRRSLGLLASVLGGAAIWLRGYVVPGTPRFAPRLVAPLPIDIGLDHRAGLDSGSLADDAVTLEADEDDARTVETAGDDARTVQAETDDPEADEPDTPPERDADPERATDSDPGHDAGIAPSDGAAGGEDDGDGDAVDPKTLMATLIDAGALVDDGETLRLDESFRTAMYDRIAALRRGSDETLAERAAAVAGPDTDGQVHDGRILLAGQRDAWLSRPIALAETAAAETLRERGVDDGVARGAARPLRAFLDTCPACDGSVRDTTLRNCCGGPGGVSGNPERAVRACADCDAVVFADRS
ncbi:hypothetical protein [Halorubrum lacusprofundi]|jgi:hypothetical protein|uniref:Uncharacterized protein n=1 Tax=Halorubrum lacusprofundi (strain ATCC 49239 / DSM 5036 / JCM 8891 / ACAM 34) TaxID=416348 RepID=B9LT81_HALLT|nr:hypothetical protein [Halorubrum lacusprofundi]ACM58053.1 conserved hypothetical protein [Halorubrum lacusprofundi ATCC 49239]MCG1006139.1 hypothetical protein [Halorubrum lacusprofundi]